MRELTVKEVESVAGGFCFFIKKFVVNSCYKPTYKPCKPHRPSKPKPTKPNNCNNSNNGNNGSNNSYS